MKHRGFQGHRVALVRLVGFTALAFCAAGMVHAADKQIVTFAAASFAEPARGEKMRAWIAKFNQSQDKVEIQPVTIPFSSFSSTIFTQMGGNAGPDLVRFDLPEFYAAVDAKRLAPIDDVIADGAFPLTGPDKYMKVGGAR